MYFQQESLTNSTLMSVRHLYIFMVTVFYWLGVITNFWCCYGPHKV